MVSVPNDRPMIDSVLTSMIDMTRVMTLLLTQNPIDTETKESRVRVNKKLLHIRSQRLDRSTKYKAQRPRTRRKTIEF